MGQARALLDEAKQLQCITPHDTLIADAAARVTQFWSILSFQNISAYKICLHRLKAYSER